ncbi:MAG: spore germination protein [Sporomusaceae bacterium]|nr:spore germination protein [Sporomusaceae bacterium]
MSKQDQQHIGKQLRDLQSLLAHAKEAEQQAEAIVGTLRDRYVNPDSYPVSEQLHTNLENLRIIFRGSGDVVIREFTIAALNRPAAVVFTESMADPQIIANQIIEKLSLPPLSGLAPCPAEGCDVTYLKSTLLTAAAFTEESGMQAIVRRILSGDAALWIEGSASVIIIATQKLESRDVAEPQSEPNIRGPREGFTEELRTNVTLLRRRMPNPNLVVRQTVVGSRSHTDVAIIYFRGIANYKLVFEVENRIDRLDIDMPIGGNEIQGLIEDHPNSPFPTLLATERPDKVLSSVMEGRVAILVNGSPFALLTPTTLADFFQAGDDYYENWITASIIRLTRYVAAFFAMTMPALYVAITTFHPGLIPPPLTLTITTSRTGIPLPAFLEAVIMEIMLEVMQESGVRLPKNIGPAVSIAGSLVIGEAAVRAGIVSSPLVIITAFTAVASFVIPNYRLSMTIRFFRVPLMMLAASFGMFGLTMGMIAILVHLSLLESFGEPYIAPFAPKNLSRISDLKDTFISAPPEAQVSRPAYLEPQDSQKQKPESKP